jgi:hypothetical protein
MDRVIAVYKQSKTLLKPLLGAALVIRLNDRFFIVPMVSGAVFNTAFTFSDNSVSTS